MEANYVRHVELLGFEKRLFPSRHFVYMLMVKWSDLSEKLIYRTYPEIHTFHKSLKEMFPIEAGQIEKRDRIIPSLPAPRWLDSEKSTETRQGTLSEYFHSLINLPPHISRCKQLNSLFKVRPEDENPPAANTVKRNETFVESRELARGVVSEISGPIVLDSYRVVADFAKTSKHEINLHTGDLVEIIEKNPNGELHVSVNAYKAEQEDEISLELGETIEVIHKLLDGWWVVRKGDETGHFPSMFLHKAGKRAIHETERIKVQGQKPPPRRSTIRNAKSIHNKSRLRMSEDTYRRNSRRYLQQKGGQISNPHKNSKNAAQSPLRERKNQGNIAEQPGSSSESELKKEAPVIPPRPSTELILERCSDNTRKKVSIKSRPSSASAP
ncbi:Neutrophil cytosolic factor 1 [Collichthys lucidus]|uniref:Neutrophil cytosolic factor 1 n=1 Tax=Collichthys lucidus TaxID=240159 RepID=A0A4U5V643_COLLU|nr:Neutrophil cytosolic factor 1 [Collichthys lucidus]